MRLGFLCLQEPFPSFSFKELHDTGATVKLWKEGTLLGTYNVPTEENDGDYEEHYVWKVFSIDENGTLTVHNELKKDCIEPYKGSCN